MKLLSKIALTVALVAGMSAAAQAQISYTGGTYTQDFDSMGSDRDDDTYWVVRGHRHYADLLTGTTVIPGTGTGTAGGNYNLGVAGVTVTDRALGSLASGGSSAIRNYAFTNNTGLDITMFAIAYDGEQWRVGGTAAVAQYR